VASLHNTSVKMIEASYAKHITEHGDEHARAALLHHDELAPVADNVVAISGR